MFDMKAVRGFLPMCCLENQIYVAFTDEAFQVFFVTHTCSQGGGAQYIFEGLEGAHGIIKTFWHDP